MRVVRAASATPLMRGMESLKILAAASLTDFLNILIDVYRTRMTQHPNLPDYLRAEREAFYTGDRTERLPLVVNDSVYIKEDSKKGKFAAVISLECIDPEPLYLVELGPDGDDVVLPLSHLERIKI